MRRIQIFVPAVILGAGLLLNSTGYAKPEFTKKEKKGCVVCHVKNGVKELNKVGECYKKNNSLATCDVK